MLVFLCTNLDGRELSKSWSVFHCSSMLTSGALGFLLPGSRFLTLSQTEELNSLMEETPPRELFAASALPLRGKERSPLRCAGSMACPALGNYACHLWLMSTVINFMTPTSRYYSRRTLTCCAVPFRLCCVRSVVVDCVYNTLYQDIRKLT